MKKIDQTFWEQTLSSGRLLLQMGPKRISLLEAGQLIDKNHLKKYQDSNLVLDVCTDQDKYEEYVSLFSDLKNKKFEKDQRELAKKILKAVFEDWKKEQTHLLTFATACFDSFNTLPREELVKIDNTDLRLFKKAIYASAIAVVAAISNDYFEFNLIKDLYLVTFVLDVGLCDTNYSYHIAMAVDEESKLAGAGIDYLKTVHASEKEHELFLKHPEKSHDLIESLAFNMSYPELSEIVLYQHETTQGSGFPRGVTKREISTWDAVCLYADGVVMMSSLSEFEKSPLRYLLEKSFEKQDHLPIKKVFLRIKNAISYFDNYSLEERAAS
jgi:hypothetical protein